MSKVYVPPIKCQGIKTKIVPIIKENISLSEDGYWIEPFLGSGVVLFNVAPKKAIISDKNIHIINLYKKIQDGEITPSIVRKFLKYHGDLLAKNGQDYYYEMRDMFNSNKDPLYFLFLNRSCFNGMIRFNRNGFFNIPFCKKDNRFAPAYITKIVNQVASIQEIMRDKEWIFKCQSWQETLKEANPNDFVYLDPPYIGRDTSYVGEWPIEEAEELAKWANETQSKVMLSMWKENKYRKNDHIEKCWSTFYECNFSHFYHLGAKETNRNEMTEVLLMNYRKTISE